MFQLTLLNTCQSVQPLGTHVGTEPQSLINLPVIPSNTAKCQSVALEGPTTSQLPPPQPHVVVH